MKTLVLKVKGLTDGQTQEEFTEFFDKLVEKYPDDFGAVLVAFDEGSEQEKEILRIARL